MVVEQFPDRVITINQKDYLYFGGTSYLGLATHPQFQDSLFKGIKKWGSAYGSSRNSNVKLAIYDKAEDLLSHLIGSDECVTVSSGTLAGKLMLDYLDKFEVTFYHYPKTHPAILKNNSVALFLDGMLHPDLQNSKKETVVISVDAILSNEVTITSFDFLEAISSTKSIILLIDESHSFGVFGNNGFGIFNQLSHPKIKHKIMISSLTKAMGCAGGLIAGDKIVIDAIKKDDVFISSSGMSPMYLYAFFHSQEIIKQQQEQLKQNLDFLFEDLKLSDLFKYNQSYPVIYCNHAGIFDYLKSKNILITNFKYPNYDVVMNRIVVTTNHTEEDLEALKKALLEFQNEVV
ncbi:aminotransferase class I/II-fold pyridoxal phosphate-dependent enzyme [Geojedonia litorea]|uniref:Aminotransferase class I/II-fold pyridoxal phosphate-dependent enzyme n=1 Tax=Geojedonia litorea TaxID=1268269 RepID=A0ABV9N5C0_9FLAO